MRWASVPLPIAPPLVLPKIDPVGEPVFSEEALARVGGALEDAHLIRIYELSGS